MFKILGTLKKQKRKLEFECTAERRLFVKFYKHNKKKNVMVLKGYRVEH